MKLTFSCICVALLLPAVALAIPPRESVKKPQKTLAKPTLPTPNPGTPSLSSARPKARPRPDESSQQQTAYSQKKQLGGSIGGPYDSVIKRKPTVSLMPTSASNRPTDGGNRLPGGLRLPMETGQWPNQKGPSVDRAELNQSAAKWPGKYRPGYDRPIDHRPEVVVNRPDINFNRPTINRPEVNVNRPVINRPVNNNTTIVNRPITNINNTTVSSTVVNNNTNFINKNYGTQNTLNRPGYGPGGYDRPPRNYYPQLHHHWQPTTWSSSYRPAYYNFGYSSGGMTLSTTSFAFANPYYVRPAATNTVLYDYSQPIRVPAPNYEETDDELIRSERAINRFDDAREVFRRGEYGRANELVNQAIEFLPTDPILHEFRSLVLFARHRYSDSAAALYSVLAVSSGWDAGTIAKLYDDPQNYLKQAADLEEYVKANLGAMDSRFLLVYHDLVRGDQLRAERLLASCVAAQPDDPVLTNLLQALRGKLSEQTNDSPLP